MQELQYQLGRCIGKGSSSHVYELVGHSDLLLKTIDSVNGVASVHVNIHAVRETIARQRQLSEGVALAKMLEVGKKNGFAAVVIERAPGSAIYTLGMSYGDWSIRAQEFAQVSQEAYNKAVFDAKQIMDAGLAIDLCPENFFYDSQKGITFIDVNKGYQVPSLQIPFTLYPVLNTRETHLKTEEDLDNLEQITKKLIQVGDFDPRLIKF
jgi:hypothetical protein